MVLSSQHITDKDLLRHLMDHFSHQCFYKSFLQRPIEKDLLYLIEKVRDYAQNPSTFISFFGLIVFDSKNIGISRISMTKIFGFSGSSLNHFIKRSKWKKVSINDFEKILPADVKIFKKSWRAFELPEKSLIQVALSNAPQLYIQNNSGPTDFQNHTDVNDLLQCFSCFQMK